WLASGAIEVHQHNALCLAFWVPACGTKPVTIGFLIAWTKSHDQVYPACCKFSMLKPVVVNDFHFKCICECVVIVAAVFIASKDAVDQAALMQMAKTGFVLIASCSYEQGVLIKSVLGSSNGKHCPDVSWCEQN